MERIEIVTVREGERAVKQVHKLLFFSPLLAVQQYNLPALSRVVAV